MSRSTNEGQHVRKKALSKNTQIQIQREPNKQLTQEEVEEPTETYSKHHINEIEEKSLHRNCGNNEAKTLQCTGKLFCCLSWNPGHEN